MISARAGWKRRCAGLVLGLACSWHARAQGTATPSVPETRLSLQAASEKSLMLFTKSCAQCHDAGSAPKGGPAGGLGTILDLDSLAQDRSYVVAGMPDASPLYHALLAGHRPQTVFNGSGHAPAPTPEDIEAVRDWIEQLPETNGGCPGRTAVSSEDIARLGEEWRKLAGADGVKIQFVSLATPYNACRSESQIAAIRESMGSALASLAGRSKPVPIDTVGDLSLLIAFKPDEAGFTPDQVAELMRADPAAPSFVLSGDWLVHEAHRKHPAPAKEVVALRYAHGVDLIDAALELREKPDAIRGRLAALDGQDGKLGRRLLQGRLPRSEWDGLRAILTKKAPTATGSLPAGASKIALQLSLWSDNLSYRTKELAQFTAAASSDCYVTLIGIDKAGQATVLFPNDLDRNNLLRGGTSMTVPVPGASYQFRFKEPGRETVVGLCTSPEERPYGISHEFERQRFTVLGPWRTFLRSMSEREAAIERQERRKSRGKSEAANAASSPPQEARAAIQLTIE